MAAKVRLRVRLGEVSEQLLGLLIDGFGQNDPKGQEHIAGIFVFCFYAFVLESEFAAAAAAGTDRHGGNPAQGGYIYFGAESGFGDGNGYVKEDIIAATFEPRMGLDFNGDDKVATTTGQVGLAFAAETDLAAAVDAGGDLHPEALLIPATVGAGDGHDDISGSPANGLIEGNLLAVMDVLAAWGVPAGSPTTPPAKLFENVVHAAEATAVASGAEEI